MRCEAIDAPAPARTELACVECGCTEHNACRMADGGGCSWVSLEPPLCSACVSEEDMDEAMAGFGVSRSGVYGAELCPGVPRAATRIQQGPFSITEIPQTGGVDVTRLRKI